MNTVEQLLQWLRDTGVGPGAPIVIQAFGRSEKHYDWTISFINGEISICADLAPRRRRQAAPVACPVCGGTEFEPALDNHGDAYSGCVRCAMTASRR